MSIKVYDMTWTWDFNSDVWLGWIEVTDLDLTEISTCKKLPLYIAATNGRHAEPQKSKLVFLSLKNTHSVPRVSRFGRLWCTGLRVVLYSSGGWIVFSSGTVHWPGVWESDLFWCVWKLFVSVFLTVIHETFFNQLRHIHRIPRVLHQAASAQYHVHVFDEDGVIDSRPT